MNLIKAPKLERKHIQALKTLIHLNFARAVRIKLEALQATPEHPAETTSKLMKLAEMLSDNEQPLTITCAMMEMYGSPEALLPLDETRYNFYLRTLGSEIGPEDFRTIPEDKLAVILEPLKVLQGELRQRFADAMQIDAQEIHRAAHALQARKVNLRPPTGGTPPPTGLMN